MRTILRIDQKLDRVYEFVVGADHATPVVATQMTVHRITTRGRALRAIEELRVVTSPHAGVAPIRQGP